jgi:hypothetical protein
MNVYLPLIDPLLDVQLCTPSEALCIEVKFQPQSLTQQLPHALSSCWELQTTKNSTKTRFILYNEHLSKSMLFASTSAACLKRMHAAQSQQDPQKQARSRISEINMTVDAEERASFQRQTQNSTKLTGSQGGQDFRQERRTCLVGSAVCAPIGQLMSEDNPIPQEPVIETSNYSHHEADALDAAQNLGIHQGVGEGDAPMEESFPAHQQPNSDIGESVGQGEKLGREEWLRKYQRFLLDRNTYCKPNCWLIGGKTLCPYRFYHEVKCREGIEQVGIHFMQIFCC